MTNEENMKNKFVRLVIDENNAVTFHQWDFPTDDIDDIIVSLEEYPTLQEDIAQGHQYDYINSELVRNIEREELIKQIQELEAQENENNDSLQSLEERLEELQNTRSE